MIKIPKFRRIDERVEQYEATTDDGARMVVVYNDQWESWFWYVQRQDQMTVAGSAPDLHEAQERAIGAWLSTR
jgi:deoxyadenosine/deoxycytidine kinase